MSNGNLPPILPREWAIRRLVADPGFQGYAREYKIALDADSQDGLDLALKHRRTLEMVQALRPSIIEIGRAYQQIVVKEQSKV